MAFPHGAVGLSAVCDCGISLSYSLTFSENQTTVVLEFHRQHNQSWGQRSRASA